MENNASDIVITPPASEPITLADVKGQLRLDVSDTSEDAELNRYISAVRQRFEELTYGRVCVATTFEEYFPKWNQFLRLGKGKVSSIVSVHYFDSEDEEQELESYRSDLTGIPAVIWKIGGFPAVSEDRPRPIRVRYVAGYADAASVPADIKRGLLGGVGDYYLNRESVDTEKFSNFCRGWDTGLGAW